MFRFPARKRRTATCGDGWPVNRNHGEPMLIIKNRFALALIAFVGSAIVAMPPAAGQQPAGGAGPFTAAQAAAGASAYQANCATCHQPDLRGQGTATPLAGTEFIGAWGSRAARDLVSFIQLTMPPGNPGMLDANTYADIAAFILRSNGARAGNQSLTARSEVVINSVATGQAATAASPPAPASRRPSFTTVSSISITPATSSRRSTARLAIRSGKTGTAPTPPVMPCAASGSMTTRFLPQRAMRISSRSMPEPGRRCGRRLSATGQKATTRPAAARSLPRER